MLSLADQRLILVANSGTVDRLEMSTDRQTDTVQLQHRWSFWKIKSRTKFKN